jgi:hypothetical protein
MNTKKTPQEKQLSSCCKAGIYVHSEDEGTNYYVCAGCNLPVNPDGTNPHKLLKPAPQEKEIDFEDDIRAYETSNMSIKTLIERISEKVIAKARQEEIPTGVDEKWLREQLYDIEPKKKERIVARLLEKKPRTGDISAWINHIKAFVYYPYFAQQEREKILKEVKDDWETLTEEQWRYKYL